MPCAAAVFSSAFFLALALKHCGLDPQCPADPTTATMISVQHDPADGSLSLGSTTPRPLLREGELLVKVVQRVHTHMGFITFSVVRGSGVISCCR